MPKPGAPSLGILGTIKDRVNADAISGRLIENLEWEPPDKCPPELVYRDRIQ
jgi:hypothetical protein